MFKILISLSREENYFALAQDSYPILLSLISQLDSLSDAIARNKDNILSLFWEDDKAEEIARFQSTISTLEESLAQRPFFESIILPLMPLAQEFWFCGPFDKTDNADSSSELRKAVELWRIYHGHEGEITVELKLKIDLFKDECSNFAQLHCNDMLMELLVEEAAEAAAQEGLRERSHRYSSAIPLACLREFESTNQSFFITLDFPFLHFRDADLKFAKLLGFSVARILTMPLLSFIVNTGQTNDIIGSYLFDHRKIETVTQPGIVFYRSITRDIFGVHWEACPKKISGCFMWRGFDITRELEEARSAKMKMTQQTLKKWLHSIRNASFQQQAEVIRQDVEILRKNVGDDKYAAEFGSILDGINTLIYTTKASVGLIDQALDSQDLVYLSPVHEFVKSIAQLSNRFAKFEGIVDMPHQFELFLNEVPVTCDKLAGIYLKGDLTHLTTIIENIISNAVRHTNREVGVEATLHILVGDSFVQFALDVTDHCDGGLPDHVVKYFKEHLSIDKVVDIRSKAKASMVADETPSSIFDRRTYSSASSVFDRTYSLARKSGCSTSMNGVSNIVELYRELTHSGENDFDMTICVKAVGTTFSLNATYELVAPSYLHDDESSCYFKDAALNVEVKASNDTRVMLIVDDSHVVRRLLERYLDKVGVPHYSCKDGVEALEWFKENNHNCRGLVTDLEMPKMGGDALIYHVLRLKPIFPCVIVSGNNVVAKNLPRGVMKAILKPVTLAQVVEIVADMKTFEIHHGINQISVVADL